MDDPMETPVTPERKIPFFQDPHTDVTGGYRQAPEGEIDWQIDWNPKIPKENRFPPRTSELIELMNEIRELAAITEPGGCLEVVGRHEVVVAVAKKLDSGSQGTTIVDYSADGPIWAPDEGIWESTLHVFANKSELDNFLAND